MSRTTTYRRDRVYRGGRAKQHRRMIELGVAVAILAAITAVVLLSQ